MNYKSIVVSMAILTFIFTGGIDSVKAGYISGLDNGNSEEAEVVLESIETGDYKSWRKLINQDNQFVKGITKSQFDQLVVARNMARSGNYSEAMEIYSNLRESLGISKDRIRGIADAISKILK